MVQPLQCELQQLWPCLLIFMDSDVQINADYQKVSTTMYWQKEFTVKCLHIF